jgi:uncharacterized protein (TIGR02145 family)
MKKYLTILICLLMSYSFCQKIKNGPTIKDIDGNIYKTIFIGDKHWMLENLKTTKFNDGQEIVFYNNFPCENEYAWTYSENNKNKGKFYSWYVVDPFSNKEICPVGWRVPDKNEWVELKGYLLDKIRNDLARNKFYKLFFSDIKKNVNTSPYGSFFWTNETYGRTIDLEYGYAAKVVWNTDYFSFTTDLDQDVFLEKNKGAYIRCLR